MSQPKPKRTVDTSGQVCPQPMLAATRAVRAMQSGEVLELVSTDLGSRMDIPAWCARTGHTLLSAEEADGIYRYLIECRGTS